MEYTQIAITMIAPTTARIVIVLVLAPVLSLDVLDTGSERSGVVGSSVEVATTEAVKSVREVPQTHGPAM